MSNKNEKEFSLEELQLILKLASTSNSIYATHPLALKICKIIEQEKIAQLHTELIVLSNN